MPSTGSISQDLRQARALTLDSMAQQAPPLAPFAEHGARASLCWAIEPHDGAWDDLRRGPELDLIRLFVRPWRDRPEDAMLPGSILAKDLDPLFHHDLNLCILNMTLAAHVARGEPTQEGAVAIDAGCCWIVMPPVSSRRSFHFLRKDGVASLTKFHNIKYFPQDQETSWSVPELERASSIMWQMCLATADALLMPWDENPLMRQARDELVSSFELSELDALTPKVCLPGTRKPGL